MRTCCCAPALAPLVQLFALCCVQGRNLWPAAYTLRWVPWPSIAPGIELVDSGAKVTMAESSPRPGGGAGGAAAGDEEEGSEEAGHRPETTRRKRRFLRPEASCSAGRRDALIMDLPLKAHLPEVRVARRQRTAPHSAAAWHGGPARRWPRRARWCVCVCGRGCVGRDLGKRPASPVRPLSRLPQFLFLWLPLQILTIFIICW